MKTENLKNVHQYDILIIGAGIFGAMLALESSQRGLKVLLVEKSDFGSGTSANSLKTIHGGLRYLQSMDIRSSIISAKERKAWLTIAPGLVKPLPCILPTTKDLMKSKLVVGSGALFYNALTMNRNLNMSAEAQIPNAHLLSISALNEVLPTLKDGSVTGGARWYDAQAANTERLVMACLLAAKEHGAQIVNYHILENLEKNNKGYKATLVATPFTKVQKTEDVQVHTRWLIDCTGRGQFLEKDYLEHEQAIKQGAPTYVKAINLVVKKKISSHAFGLKAMDDTGISRLLFIAPWPDTFASNVYSLIGTWYFDSRSKDLDSISDHELIACIDQVNSAFLKPLITVEDVTQVHVGHLPADSQRLIDKGPDSALKKHAKLQDWGTIKPQYEGLYSLKGTKFTLARKAAENTIKYLEHKHELKLGPSVSASNSLWSITTDSAELLEKISLSQDQRYFILQYFSSGLQKIISLCADNELMLTSIPGANYCCHAVVEYCVRYEQVQHLTDMLVRRLPLGNAELPAEEIITYVLELMASHFSWDEQRRAWEIKQLKNYYMKRVPEGSV